ncbi:hypothetical protein B7P43_G18399 [Cryptotermes secundus]|uniref:Uncharacterized protein n=1 Tax=Cryptotermes secundus TaxID=105785 RepID=A0A2J7QNQ5_9NEOP|nr:hypothetical protein B7P43_G18399 [Cryptotermes secundus]
MIVPTGSIKRLTSGRIKRLELCPSPVLSQERSLLFTKNKTTVDPPKTHECDAMNDASQITPEG